LNLTFSFAAFGIKYGAVDQSFAPPYFMKVNGMPYWRMLFANNASESPANPLHMYIYDSDYQIKDNPLPQQLRDVVKRCMLQTNDLAQKLRNLANEHNVEEVSLHINCDSNTARAPSDITALIVKHNGTAKASPRTLIIYPHKNGFTQDFPGLDTEAASYTFGEHHTGQVATADAADRTRVAGHQDQFRLRVASTQLSCLSLRLS
jgi:hypothetical protein